ncbi:hypothetical protein FALBO_13330 [Fusarium albosuccineum]|uniref:EthD domain-containing protein n=1 Tax=Fusarium albosuccineum TaxID=1237068 RepID=A0A8H4L081_9HYPO|nr:hypothetical protein FALBO_13330 [Fusarium albosuccineum]
MKLSTILCIPPLAAAQCLSQRRSASYPNTTGANDCCCLTYKPSCTMNQERMFHIKVFYNRKQGITPEEFNHYWANGHAELTKPFLLRVGVYHSTPDFRDQGRVEGAPQILEFDGAAEFWVPTLETFQAMGQDPEYIGKIVPDEAKFIDQSTIRMIIGVDYIGIESQNAVMEHVFVRSNNLLTLQTNPSAQETQHSPLMPIPIPENQHWLSPYKIQYGGEAERQLEHHELLHFLRGHLKEAHRHDIYRQAYLSFHMEELSQLDPSRALDFRNKTVPIYLLHGDEEKRGLAALILMVIHNYIYRQNYHTCGAVSRIATVSVLIVLTDETEGLSAPISFGSIADRVEVVAVGGKAGVRTDLGTAISFVMFLEEREDAFFGPQPDPVASTVHAETGRWVYEGEQSWAEALGWNNEPLDGPSSRRVDGEKYRGWTGGGAQIDAVVTQVWEQNGWRSHAWKCCCSDSVSLKGPVQQDGEVVLSLLRGEGPFTPIPTTIASE